MIHTLTIKDENLHGSFSNEYKPALTMSSCCPSSWGNQIN
ncbi:hypothetical protein KIS1582_0345 [Cytobacillus firmus]|uniref:Uncharacterized protein n=1 Tax=Cytobacillus firmus TaxID=1399 RepID=A0A800NFG7_CYTFI|nr:hypothetical protein KIS1582_0345 [Cytobacillus firmus]